MDLVVFDLDGTLIDSKADLAAATNATRVHLGYEPLSEAVVASYVGNGAPVLIRRALGADASDELVADGLAFFLQYYRQHMLDKTVLYPGVREALDELLAARVPMAVLTNKPIVNSIGIVEGLGLKDHFFRVYGGDSFPTKKPDPMGLDALVNEAKSEKSRTLMVGDSYVDIKTARNAQVKACGVTFGLQPESLVAEPPDLLVDDMREMSRWVLEGR